ncbi:MAG TPA: LysR substrate-binding domain-containing protein [Thermoanaerobaculia bacterium]|nr:LysR substrate-binding domain-containing protein [Thermoanaerobaculia bacterium]
MRFAPHPYTLRQLQYVVAVAEELSFRRAAERCHVSQPSLSAQLAQLEHSLGVCVFERSQRGVILTAAGRDIVERARRLLVDADALMEAGKLASDPLAGTLRIGVIPTISPYLLPAVTPRLRAKFPRILFAWIEDKTDILVRKLAEGELEGVLLALESEVEDVDVEVIARDPFVLVTRPEHPLAGKKSPATASELRGEDMLLLDDGHCFRDQALEVCLRAGAREGEFRATSLSTLVQMVAGGAGITLLPALAVAAEVKRARLKVRPVASPAAGRTIALVWRKRSPLAATLRQIAAVLRDSYPNRKGTPRASR